MPLFIHRTNGAKWSRGMDSLRPLIHECALISRVRQLIVVIFPKVLPKLRTNDLKEIAEPTQQWIVSPHRMVGANQILVAKHARKAKHGDAKQRKGIWENNTPHYSGSSLRP